eukprot:GHVU01136814.1.p1 GENE.GHVU01136814.1~~GHVU01136814.1.p1  ORF type:complete len:187 (+),score=14.59 GHVU01136814.1:167-727(+)
MDSPLEALIFQEFDPTDPDGPPIDASLARSWGRIARECLSVFADRILHHIFVPEGVYYHPFRQTIYRFIWFGPGEQDARRTRELVEAFHDTLFHRAHRRLEETFAPPPLREEEAAEGAPETREPAIIARPGDITDFSSDSSSSAPATPRNPAEVEGSLPLSRYSRARVAWDAFVRQASYPDDELDV